MKELSYQLTPTFTIGIVRDPIPDRLLTVTGRGSEVLGRDKIMDLLVFCHFAVRLLEKKRHPNSRKWRNIVPTHVRLEPDVKMLLGRLDRAFKEGRESLED